MWSLWITRISVIEYILCRHKSLSKHNACSLDLKYANETQPTFSWKACESISPWLGSLRFRFLFWKSNWYWMMHKKRAINSGIKQYWAKIASWVYYAWFYLKITFKKQNMEMSWMLLHSFLTLKWKNWAKIIILLLLLAVVVLTSTMGYAFNLLLHRGNT